MLVLNEVNVNLKQERKCVPCFCETVTGPVQRAILNFTPGPQGCTWPSGVKFVPYGECSTLCSRQGVNTLYCLEEWSGEQISSPLRDNFTPRGQLRPWG
jgi:hypothetical protein